jgi:2',3'-cyclic-nucleotide 2'-phosphodiesterase (5'-nucleotidase family)
MGGHDHDNQIYKIGQSTVAKADANAKTVYIHTLRYNRKKKTATVKSELRRINASIPDEPRTAAVVAKWEKIKQESLTSLGFDPAQTVTTLADPLDCREAVVRHTQCKAGELITTAMLAVSKNKSEAALLNSGSIRVDDILNNQLTELDVVRMLPFGGGISEVEMRGSLLRQTLDAGLRNKSNGGYLQLRNIRYDAPSGKWLVGGQTLDDAKTYRIALPDFLLTGNEQNMDFLKTTLDAGGVISNPGIVKWSKPDPKDKDDWRNDIRHALIAYLRSR